MKFLLLLAAVSSARAAVTCDECQAAAQDFVSHLLSQESLAEQVEIMKANVCPQVTKISHTRHLVTSSVQLGVDGCEDILDMWYGDMAKCIFNHFILEGDACSLAGEISLA